MSTSSTYVFFAMARMPRMARTYGSHASHGSLARAVSSLIPSDWILSIFSHLYSPYFQVFVGKKADPGQSRGKPNASAEWQPGFVKRVNF